MAITFVGSDQASSSNTNSNGLTLTLPTHEANDVGIICGKSLADASTDHSISGATGWIELRQDYHTTGTNRRSSVFYKKFTSASETNPVWDINQAQRRGVCVHVFRGVDTTTQFDVTEVVTNNSNNANPTNPAITPSNDGALLLFHNFTDNDHTAMGVPATPTGMTAGEFRSSTGGNTNRGFAFAYKLDHGSASTAITPTAWTHSHDATNTSDWSCYTFALRAAAAAATRTSRLMMMGLG